MRFHLFRALEIGPAAASASAFTPGEATRLNTVSDWCLQRRAPRARCQTSYGADAMYPASLIVFERSIPSQSACPGRVDWASRMCGAPCGMRRCRCAGCVAAVVAVQLARMVALVPRIVSVLICASSEFCPLLFRLGLRETCSFLTCHGWRPLRPCARHAARSWAILALALRRAQRRVRRELTDVTAAIRSAGRRRPRAFRAR